MPQKTVFSRFISWLFDIVTKEHLRAPFTRLSITLLDLWQAIVLYYHNYWIPNLVTRDIPLEVYIYYSVGLALFATFALFSPRLQFTIAVLVINIIQWMYITFASIWFTTPPRASIGMTVFILLTCISSLWRITYLYIDERKHRG